jgi:hypothetical protein
VEWSCNKLLHCDLEDAWQSMVRRVSNSVAASTARAALLASLHRWREAVHFPAERRMTLAFLSLDIPI